MRSLTFPADIIPDASSRFGDASPAVDLSEENIWIIMWKSAIACILTACAAVTLAQRPTNISVCDYYADKVMQEHSASSQYKFIVKLINTAIIGTYTKPSEVHVPGILAPGIVNGADVALLPYFNGSLISTNRNGTPASINFLADGGLRSLRNDKPAKGTKSDQ